MRVTLVCNGRFHHFHLARQLQRHGMLDEIITGYPRFKLQDELGIPQEKIVSFPWLHASYMFALSKGLSRLPTLNDRWALMSKRALDAVALRRTSDVDIVVGLSGSATKTAERLRRRGAAFICDRGSSHILYQDQILAEEHNRWNIPYRDIDPRVVDRELCEYEIANRITVPSDFVYQSFLSKGIDAQRLSKIPYGARLDRFSKVTSPPKDKFVVLWVGAVSVRKGFLDALDAFRRLKHPKKRFRVIGSIEPSMGKLLTKWDTTDVSFEGVVHNSELPRIYSSSHVFVLSSVEEGLALVQGEALACGCPVVATENTGGRDLFTPNIEGFEVPIRSPDLIAERLQQLADDPDLRERMSEAALQCVRRIGGWDNYGNQFADMLIKLQTHV